MIPDGHLLAETYREFHRSQELRKKFVEKQSKFDENTSEIEVPSDLKERVRSILDDHSDLRWGDAIQIVLDETQLDHVRAEKQKSKQKSGDFTDADEERKRVRLIPPDRG